MVHSDQSIMARSAKSIAITLACLAAMLGTAGCSPDSSKSDGPAASGTGQAAQEPVTLTMYDAQSMKDEDFELLIAGPVKAKYPYITVKKVPGSIKNVTDAVTAKAPIDLLTFFNGDWGNYKDLDIVGDLRPLISKSKYDLGRFDQGALKTIEALSSKGELYALPYHMQFNALYYNKDLFDKFGVPYPSDGMMWEDAVELARKLTRSENGVQYSGLGMDVWTRLSLQLGVLPVDAATNRAAINSEPFRKALTVAKQLYSIPGNEPKFGRDPFVKDKTQAMFATVKDVMDALPASGMDWDVAQFPSYKDNPNVYTQYDLHVIGIGSTSKYKEEAMKVLELFLSDDVQKLSASKTNRIPVLADPKFRTYFGSDNPQLKDKHLSSIFKSRPNPNAAKFTKYHSKSYAIANTYVMEFLKGNTDLNTALRGAEEEINKWIESNP